MLILGSSRELGQPRSCGALWRSLLNRAVILEIVRNAGSPEGVIADAIAQADGLGPAFDHGEGFSAGQAIARKLFLAAEAAEEGRSRILTDIPNVCGFDNLPGFRDHRHDQSVLSLLASSRGIIPHRDPSQFGDPYIPNKYDRTGPKVLSSVFADSPYGTLLHLHRGKRGI